MVPKITDEMRKALYLFQSLIQEGIDSGDYLPADQTFMELQQHAKSLNA